MKTLTLLVTLLVASWAPAQTVYAPGSRDVFRSTQTYAVIGVGVTAVVLTALAVHHHHHKPTPPPVVRPVPEAATCDLWCHMQQDAHHEPR